MYGRNIHLALFTHFVAFVLGGFYIWSWRSIWSMESNSHCFDERNYRNSQTLHIAEEEERVSSAIPTNPEDGTPDISKILEITRTKIKTELRNYVFSQSGARKLEDLVLESGGQPLRSVIVTTWRSGSTFLGEILNAMPGSFYHYEPLRNYEIQQIRGPPNAEPATRTLLSMLKCNYDNERDSRDYFKYKKSHMQQFMHNTRLWEFCKHKKELCFDPNFTTQFCKLFPFQTMKLVRFRLHLVDELLKDETLNVRVVLLVRDPRAVLQSRHHHTFCPPAADCWDPQLVCSDMISDYMAARRIHQQRPSRLTVVRYEDLALNTINVSHKLYNLLGLNATAPLDKYIKTHTTEDLGCRSSTYRQSSTNVFKWKELLDFDDVKAIQTVCKQAMRLWGYQLADNTTHMQSKDFNPLGAYPDEFLTF